MQNFTQIREFIAKHSGDCKDEVAAATILLSRLEEMYIALSRIDRKSRSKELEILTRGREVDQLEGNDLEKACEITSSLSAAERLIQNIQKDTHTLIALHYLIKGISKEQIMVDLKEEDWHFKHEVLTRWSWLSTQKKATEKGRSFNRLYLCEVGPCERRQTIDREFFIYLKFMPCYQERIQKSYLLSEYNGDTQRSPDFIGIDEEGDKIGIEVTEATESERVSFEAKQEERLMNELVEEFKDIPCHFTIWSRPEWSLLVENLAELKAWLRRIYEGKETPTKHHRNDKYFHPKLELLLSFKPESLGFLFTDISGNGNGNGYEGDEIEYRIERAVSKRIAKKTLRPATCCKTLSARNIRQCPIASC